MRALLLCSVVALSSCQYLVPYPGVACDNGVRDGDETGVDCGGPSCPACDGTNGGLKNGAGGPCGSDDNCAQGLTCQNNTCTSPVGCASDLNCPSGQTCVGGTCSTTSPCLPVVCSAHASCQNVQGSFLCTCNAPFVGDGQLCECPPGRTGSDCSQCATGFTGVDCDQCSNETKSAPLCQGAAWTEWAVSAPPSLIASADVVTDTNTGLTWQRYPNAATYTLADARAFCANSTTSGQTGWRLPTRIELASLLKLDEPDVYLDPYAFKTVDPGLPWTPPSGPYWTATMAPGGTDLHWVVTFDAHQGGVSLMNGRVNAMPLQAAVRCVR